MVTTPASPAIQSATAPDAAAPVRTPITDSETDNETDIESDTPAGPENTEPLSASLSVSDAAAPVQNAPIPLATPVEPSLQAPIRSAEPVSQTDGVHPAQPDDAAPLAATSPDRPLPKDAVVEQPAPLPLPDPTVAATGMVTAPALPVPAPPIVADTLPAGAPLMPARITTATPAPAQPTVPMEVGAAPAAPAAPATATVGPATVQSVPVPPATPGSTTTVSGPSPAPVASPVASTAPQSIATTDVAAAPLPTLTPDAQPPAPAPVKAEAVSLLQLVRDHMTGRAASPQPTEAVQRQDTDREATAPLSSMPRTDATAVPTLITLPPAALAPVLPTAPVADLSASLGAQMVDMGVSGQWIDSLARDIAGLSANGAQGRFQINADTLGPIQVDIQQGDKGATVALTVATDLAEQALRQDGDRLRLDAGLAAVKINEVKIERAPAATDATRPDPSGQNASGQQHQQQAGQPAFQGQGQGRWQARENIAQSHKAADDAAVLNHAEAGDNTRDAVRARYA